MIRRDVLKLITAIRESHPDMVELYTLGQCYNFALILRSVFPNVEFWYDYCEGHMYSRIDQYWYDIRGVHLRVNASCVPYNHRDGHAAHRWGLSDRRRLTNA